MFNFRLHEFLFVFGLLTCCAVISVAETAPQSSSLDQQRTAVIAHRSARLGGHPEQSLAAIRHALAIGVDMIHLNPQLTKDDRYVIMHDPTLNRTTNVVEVFLDGPPNGPSRDQRSGRDYVRDYTLDEIRQLSLIGDVAQGAMAVPSLQDALDLIDGQAIAFLGLKNFEPASLAKVLAEYRSEDLLLFDVFYSDPTILRDISASTGIDAVVSMGASGSYVSDLKKLIAGVGEHLTMVCADNRKVTPEFTDVLREHDLALCISGWNHREDSALVHKNDPGPWLAALQSGARAVSTDQPEAVLELMQD